MWLFVTPLVTVGKEARVGGKAVTLRDLSAAEKFGSAENPPI